MILSGTVEILQCGAEPLDDVYAQYAWNCLEKLPKYNVQYTNYLYDDR